MKQNQERDAEICAHYRAGHCAAECGEKWGLSKQRVCKILRKGRVKIRNAQDQFRLSFEKGRWTVPTGSGKQRDIAREKRVVDLISRGYSYGEIARKLGLESRNVVAGVLHRKRRRETK